LRPRWGGPSTGDPSMSARPIVLGLSALVLVLFVVTFYVVWGGSEEHRAEEVDAGIPLAVEEEAPRPPPEPLGRAATGEMPHRPNLILITVDTVRADHLSTYGYYRDTSDGLTRLAESGAVFTRAYSSSSWTAPSIASTLSGVLPAEHGVQAAAIHRDGTVTIDPLPAGLPSLPTALAAAGYRTVGVTANGRLLAELGYGAGFDMYECIGFQTVAQLEPAVARLASDLVAAERPFFLWVHVLDPHAPYVPASGGRERFWAGEPNPLLDALPIPEAIGVALRRMPTQDDVDYLIASYDDELRYSFDFVERVIRTLDNEPYVALITSDHGEEFGDHHGMGHGYTLFNEVIHVPFVVVAPGWLSRTDVPTEVSSIDILPTLVELAGASPVPGTPGMSLVSLLRGDPLPPRDIILQSGRNARPVHGIIRDGMKYGVLRAPVEIDRLFDLTTDPEERHDLMSARTEVGRAMRDRLDTAIAEAEARRPAEAAEAPVVAPEVIERLRELGYLHDPPAPAPR
jgi:arylsulfatase A-like enzyme